MVFVGVDDGAVDVVVSVVVAAVVVARAVVGVVGVGELVLVDICYARCC